MLLKVGATLGPYEIQAPLGAGGMGEVYKAWDPRLRRQVAIKVLPPAFASDADRLRRFEQEARAAGGLNHPNILTVHDFGIHDGSPYIVTELLEGATLRRRSGETLSMDTAIDFAIQIAYGLAAAHERGIVHRDLKPENVFVTKAGRVKILDFGLAKFHQPVLGLPEQARTVSMPLATEVGRILGTVAYMAPEQMRGLPTDHRADIFALGVIVYEMLAGRRPFHGDSTADVIRAVLATDPPELIRSDRSISPMLARVVRYCLEKEAERRFQSARDVALALETLKEQTGVAPPGLTGSVARSRGRAGLLGAALVVALGVAAAAFLVGRRVGTPTGDRTASSSPSFKALTFRQGFISNARFAQDARTIIYSASWEGNTSDIFLTSADGPESRSLGLPTADLLSVSSQGELAISLRPSTGANLYIRKGTLGRVALAGGSPRELLEGVRFADWAPNGTELAVVREVEGSSRLEFPVGRVLYETPREAAVFYPRVSPSGDAVAFFEVFEGRNSWVRIVDRSGQVRTLGGVWLELGGLAWSPSGDEIWFAAAETGQRTSVFAVDRNGRQRLIARAPGGLELHDISPDGRVLATILRWREVTAGALPGDRRDRDLSWFDRSCIVDVSADLRLLLIRETGDGGGSDFGVFLRRSDGSAAVRLGDGVPLALSPDGKWALARTARRPHHLSLLPVGPGDARPLATGRLEGITSAHWSPDGTRILLLASEPNRESRLYWVSQSGDQPEPESPEGLRLQRSAGHALSPDGRLFAAVGPDAAIVLWPIGGRVPRSVKGAAPGDVPIRWTADGRGLYTFRPEETSAKITRLDLTTGQKTLWKEIVPLGRAGVSGLSSVVLSRDAAAYFYCYGQGLHELNLVQGLE